jgi:uncharacterized protein YbaP (TraB family)
MSSLLNDAARLRFDAKQAIRKDRSHALAEYACKSSSWHPEKERQYSTLELVLKTLFQIGACLFLGALRMRAGDGSDAASAVAYHRAREQQDSALATHQPWIWQIDCPRTKLWLVGCLHLGTARDAAVFPAYLPYYREAGLVYFETVPGAWESYDTRAMITRRGYLADHQSIATRLSAGTWREMKKSLAGEPQKLASYSSMEPWMAAFNLFQEEYSLAGLRSEDGLEALLQHRAAEDRKPVGALETPRDQILAMADAPPFDQEVFLKDALRGYGKPDSQTGALRDAWMLGGITRLQDVLGLRATPLRSGIHQNLIGTRNHRWVNKIREIAEGSKSAMIVVGVEHLVATPYALPELLEQDGFSIRRIGTSRQSSEVRSTKTGPADIALQSSSAGSVEGSGPR